MSGSRPHLVSTTERGLRWHLPDDVRERILGLERQLRSNSLPPEIRIIKHGPHRTVYHVAWPDLDCFLKQYRLTGLRSRLRALFRRNKAHAEFDKARAVAGRGIPTVTPIGFAEPRWRVLARDSFLLTRTLFDVEPLGAVLLQMGEAMGRTAQARLRQRIASDLGVFFARVHDAGVLHGDLHVDNILVHLENGSPRFHLIDLHAIRLSAPLGWSARKANLAMLNRWFILRASRSDRLRFWRAYFAAVTSSSQRTPLDYGMATIRREQAREVEAYTVHSNLSFWRRRDQRCLASNRYYRRVRSAVAAGHAVTDLDRDALDRLLADPDEPFRRRDAVWLKDSPSSSVVELSLPCRGELRAVVYKRFRVTTRSDPIAALFRPSPALRSWLFGHGLRERLLATARPLAVFHRRRWGFSFEGYLLTEKILDALDLHQWVADLAGFPEAQRRRALRHLIERVAGVVRDLHRRRLSHRDLKAANLLVQGGKTDSLRSLENATVWIIDLVGVRRHKRIGRARRVRNLARLHASFHRNPLVTRTDKLRFLRTYLQWGLCGSAGWKSWWADIEAATSAKIARNRRSGRPLT